MKSPETALREAMRAIAEDIPPADRLAATALQRARRRRRLTRTTVAVVATAGAAAVVGAAVPLALGPHEPAGTGPRDDQQQVAPPAVAPEPSGPEIVAAPATRELSGGELDAAFEACAADLSGYDGWKPVRGVEVDADVEPGVANTWVIARHGDDYRADCALDPSGLPVGGGGEYGAKSTPALLYALVDGQEGVGVGRYVDPVAMVTVQYQDGPEQAAAHRNGFWFIPMDEARSLRESAGETGDPSEREAFPQGDLDLIGVPPGYTIRGYDAEGDLVYDSTSDGPSVTDCYADPTGTEFVGNWAGRTDPAECTVTHEWQPLD